MKYGRLAKKFLEELGKTPVVSAVCKSLGISRQTVYRWLKENEEFSLKYDECLKHGTDNINDLAKSKLIGSIDRGEKWAVQYWLNNRDKDFTRPKPKDSFESYLAYQAKKKRLAVEWVIIDGTEKRVELGS